jgi:hypothetical protein
VPANWVPAVTLVAAGVALASKALRPGTFWRNLFGSTAVVVPKEVANKMPDAKGVVTPEQVASH